MLTKISHQLKTNKTLKFFSSVKLAVPLMLTLAAIVAMGTIYESMYNSDYAKIKVYHTIWFEALMGLLWINIFLSTLSRWPYQKHHIGFVTTHIGLLTLLAGGLITGETGIDGQLRIPQGGKSSNVSLQNVILGYQFTDSPRSQSIELPRALDSYHANQDSSINSDLKHLFFIQEYVPFAQVDRVVTPNPSNPDAGVGVSFRLKSPFFQVSEWLHSKENPMMQMGPAKVFLKIGKYSQKRKPSSESPTKAIAKTSGKAKLTAVDAKTSKPIGEVSLQELKNKSWKIQNIEVQLVKSFAHATVSQNKLVEGEGTPPNPALEISILKGKEKLRDVLYAKFPNFSLQQNGVDGIKFIFIASGGEDISPQNVQMPPGHPKVGSGQSSQSETKSAQKVEMDMPTMSGAPDMNTSTNIIEFWVDPNEKGKAHIVLLKQGKVVADKEMALGESYVTPWMGITITLASIVENGSFENTVTQIEPTKGMPLPPSAVKIRLTRPAEGAQKDFWLIEDSAQVITLNGRETQIFYGQKSIELPFELKLIKFSKLDYPGTETPMSFESQVEVAPSGENVTISMNEPFKKDGFTVYQASYVAQPGQNPESIFSVNKDPGRPIKYFGSLILAIGIITFTVMRSDWYKKRKHTK